MSQSAVNSKLEPTEHLWRIFSHCQMLMGIKQAKCGFTAKDKNMYTITELFHLIPLMVGCSTRCNREIFKTGGLRVQHQKTFLWSKSRGYFQVSELLVDIQLATDPIGLGSSGIFSRQNCQGRCYGNVIVSVTVSYSITCKITFSQLNINSDFFCLQSALEVEKTRI